LAKETQDEVIYTPRFVERLLKSYLDIVSTLEGKGQEIIEAPPVQSRDFLEQSSSFVREIHARSKIDGKGKARQIEDLHCAILDLEKHLPTLHKDDQELIIRYHIRQDLTLEELAAERRVASKGSMQKRIYRAVSRLARKMENG
jgi:hypothetical protein